MKATAMNETPGTVWTISSLASECVILFKNVLAGLATGSDTFQNAMPTSELVDEQGRFRVWCGNLGALQRGHSSLDYRLKESPLLMENVTKLLTELNQNLIEAHDVVHGHRLPMEELRSTNDDVSDDGWSDMGDSVSSLASTDVDDDDVPRYELAMRLSEVVDIIDNLYKLSIRIRSPTVRSRGVKAASYKEMDRETGVDLIEKYATYDRQFVEDTIRDLRQGRSAPFAKDDFIVKRLGRAVTRRRQQFRYWRRHREKLTAVAKELRLELENEARDEQKEAGLHQANDAHTVTEIRDAAHVPVAPTDRTPQTLLSATEATKHHVSLDEAVDSMSVTSVATTARDLSGRAIEIPGIPANAKSGRDFECPYCFIICPSRYGETERGWRSHLLQDLSPYMCTYPDCEHPDQIFRSRREWLEHEATSHRQLWQCPVHIDAVFKTRSALERHLEVDHGKDLTYSQLANVVTAARTTAIDSRAHCPICYADSTTVHGGLQSHIANHLERIALFSLPRDVLLIGDVDNSQQGDANSLAVSEGYDNTTSGSDSVSSGQGSAENESNDIPLASRLLKFVEGVDAFVSQLNALNHQLPTLKNYVVIHSTTQQLLKISSKVHALATGLGSFDKERYRLDLETPLELLHDTLSMTLDGYSRQFELSSRGAEDNLLNERNWDSLVNHFAQEGFNLIKRFETFKKILDVALHFVLYTDPSSKNKTDQLAANPMILIEPRDFHELEELRQRQVTKPTPLHMIGTVDELYQHRQLAPSSQAKAEYSMSANSKLSFVFADIVQMQVDAIACPTHVDLSPGGRKTVSRAVSNAAGPELANDLKAIGQCKPGSVVVTKGYKLPCKLIFHAAGVPWPTALPDGEAFLRKLYRRIFALAVENGVRSIAIPSLLTGSLACPPFTGALIAAHEARSLLDSEAGQKFDRIVFCVFSEDIRVAYEQAIPRFFPPRPSTSSPSEQSSQPSTATSVQPLIPVEPATRSPVEVPTPVDQPQKKRSTSPPAVLESHIQRLQITDRISLVKHDISKLDVEAIAISATKRLGIIGVSQLRAAVFNAAGPLLQSDCAQLPDCGEGDAVMTDGHYLPCSKVIHSVGAPPSLTAKARQKHVLRRQYRACLEMASRAGLKSLALANLNRGSFAAEAAEIAVDEVKRYLEEEKETSLKQVIFCVYTKSLWHMYKAILNEYFALGLDIAQDEITRRSFQRRSSTNRLHESVPGPQPPQQQRSWTGSSLSRPQSSSLNSSPYTQSLRSAAPWTCCMCAARPMITRNCLVCFHKACSWCQLETYRDGQIAPAMLTVCTVWSPEMGVPSKFDWGRRHMSADNSHHFNQVSRAALSMDTLDYYGVSWDWKSSSPGEYSHFSVQDVGKDDELSEHAAVLRAWQQAKKFGHECISSAAERFSVYIGSGGVRATPWASQTLVLPGPPNFGHGKSAAICAFVRNQTKWLLYTTESDFVLRLDQAELKLPSAGGDFYEVTSGSILTIHERRSLDSRPTSNDSWPGIILRIECRPPIADFRAELEVWNEAQARIIRCRFPGFSLADEALASGIVDLQDQLKYLCGPDLLERRPLLDGQALVVPPGALMTKLSSKLIDPAVMKESRIPFSYSGEHVLVDKVLGSHEIYALWSKSE